MTPTLLSHPALTLKNTITVHTGNMYHLAKYLASALECKASHQLISSEKMDI